MFDAALICADISSSTGTAYSLRSYSAISGGDVNQAYRLEGECGKQYFLKLNDASKLTMFAAEAEGLEELVQAKAIRVPTPICHGTAGKHAYIVIEYISLSNDLGKGGAMMGRQLAKLHQISSNGRGFGWHRDNTIGITLQNNSWKQDWVDFFGKQRLGYQLDLAETNGASENLLKKGQLLIDGLDFYYESYQPQASLLHGDLWGGNAAYDDVGAPVIYDPAVYFGDRETDIAMTELFGGFSTEFYTSYEQVWPLDAGYSQRRELYKLYHILNHFNMFGGGYAAQSENIIDKLIISLP